MQGGAYAAKAIIQRVKGDIELESVSLFQQRRSGSYRAGSGQSRIFLACIFRASGMACLAIHSPYVPGGVSEPHSGVYRMGISLSHV